MKILFLLIVVLVFISRATTTSDENSRSSSEENTSSSNSGELPSSTSDENSSLISESEEDVRSSASESLECKIRYKYTIWIGDNVDEVHSINLKSDCGIVFLDAMRQASVRRKQFAFKHSTHPTFGAFVTQIAGVSNDDEANTYWMIYDLTAEPNVDNVPDDENLTSVGVSSLEVLDGHSYLFWYKTVDEDEEYN